MSHVIVRLSTNWADEFDMESFSIMSVEDFEKAKVDLANYEDEICICFGTNEDITFENGQEVLDTIETENITEEIANIICRTVGDDFGMVTFGSVLGHIESDVTVGGYGDSEIQTTILKAEKLDTGTILSFTYTKFGFTDTVTVQVSDDLADVYYELVDNEKAYPVLEEEEFIKLARTLINNIDNVPYNMASIDVEVS